MSEPELLWPGGPSLKQAAHFRLGTDCVLLADFVNTAGARRGIDLGCASGAAMLLLLERAPKLSMTGLEIVPEAAALARENMALNGFSDRAEIVTGDIREHRSLFRAGSFDLLVCNPPYFPQKSGALPCLTQIRLGNLSQRLIGEEYESNGKAVSACLSRNCCGPAGQA